MVRILDLITRGPSNDAVALATSMDNAGPAQEEASRSARPAAFNVDRAITAAAKNIDLTSRIDAYEAADTPWRMWQTEAWDHYDNIGEINYGYEMLGAVMSRLRLYPAVVVDPDAPPTSISQIRRRIADQNEAEAKHEKETGQSIPSDLSDDVLAYMETLLTELGSGYGGIAGLLRMFTLNTAVPGECYLAFIDGRWSIRSTSEVSVRQGDGVPILREARMSRNPNGMPWRELDRGKTALIRIWRQHPRYSKEPVSSMIALLELCRELRSLQQMIRGIARSRMNAGLLYIPDGLRLAGASVDKDIEATEDETEDLMDELFDAVVNPITDETAATTAVPLMITGPDDLGEKIRHISFARESDQWLIKRAEETLVRILNGLNIPKEKVEGLSNVRYTNANVVDEDLYRLHIEPLAVMLCDAITSAYVRARLRQKFPDLSDATLGRLVFWYDPTEIVIKSDPAESANEGYDRFLISGDAWRRSHGYSDADAPSQAEIAMRTVIDQIGKNLSPTEQAVILRQVLPELFGEGTPTDSSPLPAKTMPQDRTYGPEDAVSTVGTNGNGSGPATDPTT